MEVIKPLRPDDVNSIQHNFSHDCFLCKPFSRLPEPKWYDCARQQCMRALTDGAIMSHAIRGTMIVLQIISTFVIGYYVDMKRRGTYDDGYSYTA